MKRLMFLAAGGLALCTASYAALQPGATAPDFTTEATLAGKPFTFSLAAALKSGPVVLYFYPAAFTPGCTVEAHEFAEATAKFKALGATVIGVSHGRLKDDGVAHSTPNLLPLVEPPSKAGLG